jgi:lysozyme
LIRRLNAGEAPNTVAAQELPKWNHGSNGVLPGLTRRRAAEVVLFKDATSEKGIPC